ncbi:MAG: cytochrome c maturation protein CcmE [Pseudomonadota bacterium]
MRARTRRLWTVTVSAALVLAAAGLTVFALRQTADLFYTPGKLAEIGLPDVGRRVKVGGFVEPGSLSYAQGAQIVFTVVDDTPHSIRVRYVGIAPDLFREGSGVVATGAFETSGDFAATQLLAKHDETYVPRELKDIEAPDA